MRENKAGRDMTRRFITQEVITNIHGNDYIVMACKVSIKPSILQAQLDTLQFLLLTELFEVTGSNNKPYCTDMAQSYSLWLCKKLKAHYIILERWE